MFSTKSPFIPKIAIPASPTRNPGNMYLSKSKLNTAIIVATNINVETKTATIVRPIFCFRGLSMFTKGIPSPKSTGITIIQFVK